MQSIVHVVDRTLMMDIAPLSSWNAIFVDDAFGIGFSMMREALAAAGFTDQVTYPISPLTFFAPTDKVRPLSAVAIKPPLHI